MYTYWEILAKNYTELLEKRCTKWLHKLVGNPQLSWTVWQESVKFLECGSALDLKLSVKSKCIVKIKYIKTEFRKIKLPNYFLKYYEECLPRIEYQDIRSSMVQHRFRCSQEVSKM